MIHFLVAIRIWRCFPINFPENSWPSVGGEGLRRLGPLVPGERFRGTCEALKEEKIRWQLGLAGWS